MGAAAARVLPPLKDRVDEKRKELKPPDFTTEPTDEVVLRGPPDGHPPRAQRRVPGLLALSRAQGDAAAARARRPPKLEGEGETCPQCGEGTLATQARPVRAVPRLLALPGLRRTSSKEGPPPPGPAAVRGHVPQERRRPPDRASRPADRERLLGVLRLPQVRLHDQRRADRRRPRRHRRGACRWPGRGRAPRRRGDVPDLRRDGRAARGGPRRAAPRGWPARPGGARSDPRGAGAVAAGRRATGRAVGGRRASVAADRREQGPGRGAAARERPRVARRRPREPAEP